MLFRMLFFRSFSPFQIKQRFSPKFRSLIRRRKATNWEEGERIQNRMTQKHPQTQDTSKKSHTFNLDFGCDFDCVSVIGDVDVSRDCDCASGDAI